MELPERRWLDPGGGGWKRRTYPCRGASACSPPGSPWAPSQGIWRWAGSGAGNSLVVLVQGEPGRRGRSTGCLSQLLAPSLARHLGPLPGCSPQARQVGTGLGEALCGQRFEHPGVQ